MGKLSALPPRLSALPVRVAFRRDEQGHSAQAEPWRAWYNLKRWKDLRLRVFERDLFTCQRAECSRIEGDTSKLVCDHIAPHRGDPLLFWSDANLQTLCKPCHDRWKQRQERQAQLGASAEAGRPVKVSGAMSRPAWFRRTHVPLTVVCGPPGAGKSTYVRANAAPTDLVICFDEIATRRFGRTGAERTQGSLDVNGIADVLRIRNELLGDLMRPSAVRHWRRAWLILLEPEADHRAWWSRQVGAEVIVLPVPAAECLRRIEADAQRGDRRGEGARSQVASWWRAYRPHPLDRTGP